MPQAVGEEQHYRPVNLSRKEKTGKDQLKHFSVPGKGPAGKIKQPSQSDSGVRKHLKAKVALRKISPGFNKVFAR